jgi:hypothetical protein
MKKDFKTSVLSLVFNQLMKFIVNAELSKLNVRKIECGEEAKKIV